jgi:pyroglutamyl-peptidase
VKRMREAGIPSAVSFSAGTHGCNQVMYWTSHYVATNNMDTKVGYIHTPSLPEYVAKTWAQYLYAYQPSMSLDLMVKGLEIAIDTSLEVTEDIEMGCGFVC